MVNGIQIMLPLFASPWWITNKGDKACVALADRHYTRQSPGDKQFCRPGRNLVLRTSMGDACWVTWNGIRDDGLDAWECTLFRNEGSFLSSVLIKEAVEITLQQWGPHPQDGIITYISANKIKSDNPGYCFKCAGWTLAGRSKSGKIRLQYFALYAKSRNPDTKSKE